jgi:hypothetical protein
MACVAVVLAGGRAQAQGMGPGATLELPSLRVKVEIPQGAGEWTVRKDGADVLQRTRPVNPFLSVIFDRQKAGDTCAQAMGDLGKKGFKKAKRDDLVPPGWHTQVMVAASGNGDLVIALCASEGEVRLVALATYGAEIDDPDLAVLPLMLEVVGKAVFAAPAEPPPEEKTPPPVEGDQTPAAASDAEPVRLVLPNTGLVLLVDAGATTWRAAGAEGGRDVVTRVTPAEPTLAVRVEIVRAASGGEDGCRGILAQQLELSEKGELVGRPAWLPKTWHGEAAVTYKQGSGRALVCGEIPAGYMLATVIYGGGSLDSADVDAVRPVLAAVAVSASKLSATSSGRRRRALIGGRTVMSPEVYLGGQRLAPAVDSTFVGDVEPSLAVTFGVRQTGMLRFSPGSVFGLAGRYQLGIGWDAQNELLLDGTLGIGVGIMIADRVAVMGFAGGGGDAIGAGADPAMDKMQFDFSIFNFYLGGAVQIDLGNTAGLEFHYGYVDRGDEITETRIDGRLMVLPSAFRKVTLGVSFTDIETIAEAWGVQLGLGF